MTEPELMLKILRDIQGRLSHIEHSLTVLRAGQETQARTLNVMQQDVRELRGAISDFARTKRDRRRDGSGAYRSKPPASGGRRTRHAG